MTLDIFQPQGMELLERLVADADVLVHNVAPPDMDRAGLSASSGFTSTIRGW